LRVDRQVIILSILSTLKTTESSLIIRTRLSTRSVSLLSISDKILFSGPIQSFSNSSQLLLKLSSAPRLSLKMQFKTACFAASLFLASFSQALLVPEGLGNGVYTVSFDSNGNALAAPEFIKPLNTTAAPGHRRSSGPVLPDASTQRVNVAINRNDFIGAWQAFDSLCDEGISYPASSSVFVRSGSAIAYLCNYSKSNRCWRSEYDESVALEDIVSGPNQLGWVYTKTWDKSYGRDNAGVSIC
jgi:hypothetical protein